MHVPSTKRQQIRSLFPNSSSVSVWKQRLKYNLAGGTKFLSWNYRRQDSWFFLIAAMQDLHPQLRKARFWNCRRQNSRPCPKPPCRTKIFNSELLCCQLLRSGQDSQRTSSLGDRFFDGLDTRLLKLPPNDQTKRLWWVQKAAQEALSATARGHNVTSYPHQLGQTPSESADVSPQLWTKTGEVTESHITVVTEKCRILHCLNFIAIRFRHRKNTAWRRIDRLFPVSVSTQARTRTSYLRSVSPAPLQRLTADLCLDASPTCRRVQIGQRTKRHICWIVAVVNLVRR